MLSASDPPYQKWKRRISQHYTCQGPAMAELGGHIVATGRCSSRGTGVDASRTEVFLYEDGDLRLHTLLPSGGDTGYAPP